MRSLNRSAAALLLAAFVLGPESACADEWQVATVETRDGLRTAIVVPAGQAPAPTLIVLHGATISADLTARWSGFAEAAARLGFASVFPEGIYRLWNDGRGDGLSTSDDVGFLRRLTEELITRGVADTARIFLAGISNGGMMTLRMLCEAPELYAGAATVIASMPAEAGADCRLKKPMPVVMFNGTADPLVPYGGGGVGLAGTRGNVWAAEDTAQFIAQANGCTGPALRPMARSAREAIRIVRLEWLQCSSGRGVTLYRVEGGGHQLFGQTNILPMIFGPGTTQLSVPDLIMAAFSDQ
jgi:polyhydroxybutyrate depolymerase